MPFWRTTAAVIDITCLNFPRNFSCQEDYIMEVSVADKIQELTNNIDVKRTNNFCNNLNLATRDFYKAVCFYRIWMVLGLNDVLIRYRRTVLGPIWISIGSIANTAALALVYSQLFHLDMASFFVYVACGLALWTYIAQILTESPLVFMKNTLLAQQIVLPFNVYVLRQTYYAFVCFCHSIVGLFIVMIFAKININIYSLMFIPAMALYVVFGVWLTLLLGCIGLRYRDLSELIGVIVQLAFFMTPIFWKIELLGERTYLAEFNPLYHFIEIARAPLLGQLASQESFIIVIIGNIVGLLLALFVFTLTRRRLPYWM